MDQPVPETFDNRPEHDKRDGRSNNWRPLVAMIFSPLSRRAGDAYPRRGVATERAAIIRTRVCLDRVWAFDDLSEGAFR
jgi:hypothetical protein